MRNLLLFLCLFLLGSKRAEGSTEITYVAAVLEYEPYTEDSSTVKSGFNILKTNALTVSNYASLASQYDVDIMVAPEYGIHSLQNNYTIFTTYTLYAPTKDDDVILCYEPFSENTEALEILSCAAIVNSLYIVADIAEMNPCTEETIAIAPNWGGYSVDVDCPSYGYFFHNTQVVFNREGKVVARYRKQHLYLEPEFTAGSPDNSLAVFETDFGVTFTLQICFEMLFATPGYYNIKTNGIRDVAMSTAWNDFLPFGPADAAQDAWSWSLKANLLVSGYHRPENSKLGSGIYNAYKESEANYIYDKDSGSVMIYGSVTTFLSVPIGSPPKSKKDSDEEKLMARNILNSIALQDRDGENGNGDDGRYHKFYYVNLEPFESVLLEPTTNGEQTTLSLCSQDGVLCCDLTYQYTGNLYYRFFVESGRINIGSTSALYVGAQICMVAWCIDKDDVNSCGQGNVELPEDDAFGPFEMSAEFQAVLVVPIGLQRDLLLVPHEDINFSENYNSYGMSSSESVNNVFSLTLFGRWIEMDP